MSAPPPDLKAFHLGIVVRDLDAVAAAYQRLLSVDHWRVRDREIPASPFLEGSTPARLKVAYGRGAGMTIELLQVVDGVTAHSRFLEQHGEGVQHIGLWSADVRASVQGAIAEGAKPVSAWFDADGTATVQVAPGGSSGDLVREIDPRMIAYADPGVAGIQFEFCGPGASDWLREWLQDDFDAWCAPPAWEP